MNFLNMNYMFYAEIAIFNFYFQLFISFTYVSINHKSSQINSIHIFNMKIKRIKR